MHWLCDVSSVRHAHLHDGRSVVCSVITGRAPATALARATQRSILLFTHSSYRRIRVPERHELFPSEQARTLSLFPAITAMTASTDTCPFGSSFQQSKSVTMAMERYGRPASLASATSGHVDMLMTSAFHWRKRWDSACDEKRGPSMVTMVPLGWKAMSSSWEGNRRGRGHGGRRGRSVGGL